MQETTVCILLAFSNDNSNHFWSIIGLTMGRIIDHFLSMKGLFHLECLHKFVGF